MDKKAIETVITFSRESCPAFTYENPLLDRNVSYLLAKGFVKVLTQINTNKDYRHLVLKTIRNSCNVAPSDHLSIDDDVTEILQNSYEELQNDHNSMDSDKILDKFLIRNLKEMNICSLHSPSLTLEVIQALANLKGSKDEMQDMLLRDIIYWNVDDNEKNSQYLDILKSMCNKDFFSKNKTNCYDIPIKIKPEIEKQLLTSCYDVLEVEIVELEDWFSDNKELQTLITMSSLSSEYFQICCSIMNALFIKTNFDRQMRNFITLFIDKVKDNCIEMVYFSLLYPVHLRHIVLLLDIEIDVLVGNNRDCYVNNTLEKLQRMHKECENDVIMLLSHFNHWFDLYHNNTVKL